MNTPDITKFEQVKGTSSQPLVTRPTWNASTGKHRQDAIQEAREEAYRDYVAKQIASTPAEIRLLKMEAAIADLQSKIAELSNAKKSS